MFHYVNHLKLSYQLAKISLLMSPFPPMVFLAMFSGSKELRYIKRERDEFHEAYPTVPDSGSRVGSFGIGLSSALTRSGRTTHQALGGCPKVVR